jgi:hypothetical protein
MKTCISRFNDKYVVTIDCNTNDDNSGYMSNEMIILDLYFSILLIAERLNLQAGVHLQSEECMARFIKFAAEYNGKVYSQVFDDGINSYPFPIFMSKKSALKFKNAVDARLLLVELKIH